MTFFKTAYEQLRDLYAGLTPGLRVVAGLLTAVLAVSVIFLIMSNGSTVPRAKEAVVLNGYFFTSAEQRAVEAALGREQISGYVWERGQLKVPIKQEAAVLAAISKNNAMPQNAMSIYSSWLRETSTIESSALMKDRKEASRAASVAQDLIQKFNLEEASVFPDTKIVRDGYWTKSQTSVAVSVKPMPGEVLDNKKRGAIAGVIKGAYNIDDMSAIMLIEPDRAQPASEDWFVNSEGGMYLSRQAEAEQFWEEKIRGLLSNIDGLIVKTTVTLDPRRNMKSLEVLHHPEKPATPIYGKEKTLKEEGKGTSAGARPGFGVQGSTPLPLNVGWGYGNGEYKGNLSENEEARAIQGRENTFTEADNIPKSIFASLQIPRDYFRRVWIQNNRKPGEEPREPEPQELLEFQNALLDEVKRLVSGIIPQESVQGREAGELVNLTVYDRIVPEELPPRTRADLLSAWFSHNWGTLGLFLLIFASLGILWAVTRPAKPEPIIIYEAPEMPAPEHPVTEEDEEEEAEEIEINRTLEPFNRSIRSLQEEVSDLVAENPDAAANILRQWIGKVAVQEY
jgi:flagellar M-ring protein FliF